MFSSEAKAEAVMVLGKSSGAPVRSRERCSFGLFSHDQTAVLSHKKTPSRIDGIWGVPFCL